MKKKLFVACISGLLLAVANGGDFRMHSKAPSKSHKGYVFGYGGIDLGARHETEGNFDFYPPADPININYELHNGATFGAGFGVRTDALGGFRFELDGSIARNDVGFLTYEGFELPVDAEIRRHTAMFNILKEIPFAHATGYFGGGVGYGWSTFKGDIDTIEYDSKDEGFAWQLIAGLDFPITERLALFTQYRYLVMHDATYETNFGDFRTTTTSNPASHSFLVGARVFF
ncbi:MAG: outer membrane beta-barrel protein [Verrucomicrobiota bacterium]